jgi:Tol biopolymer transport system component
MKEKLVLFAWILLIPALAYSQSNGKAGVEYFNQPSPGLTSVIFAPGVVSLPDRFEFGSVFSKNGKEFYYAINQNNKAEILTMKREGNGWSKPESLVVHDTYSFNDPFLSPDEKRLYFISDMPLSGTGEKKKDFDIWYIERKGKQWSKPIHTGAKINSDKNEYYISFSKDGTLYFSSGRNAAENNPDDHDIYRAKNEKGEFQTPEKLGPSVNTSSYEGDVFIAPDGSYLIFCSSRPGGFGRCDLYISFSKPDGSWTEAKNMGKAINEELSEYCPFVSADGKYLFFTAKQDIKWIEARVIETLK